MTLAFLPSHRMTFGLRNVNLLSKRWIQVIARITKNSIFQPEKKPHRIKAKKFFGVYN